MANPYTTIEPDQNRRTGMDMAGLALKMMDMKQQYGMGKAKLAEQSRGNDIREQENVLAGRRIGVQEDANRLKLTEIPVHKRPFKPTTVLQKTAHFVNKFSDDIKPKVKKAIEPIFNKLHDYSAMGESSNMDAAKHFVKAWPTMREDVRGKLADIIMDKSGDEIWMGTEEAQGLNELYNLITQDKEGGQMVQVLFGPTIQSFDQETRLAEAKIASEERGPEPRAVKAYVGPGGDIINIRNNEIPPEGYVPYSSGINVETTTPDGVTTRISTGSGGRGKIQGDLTNAMQTEYQKGIKEATDAMQRVGKAISGFKPEYQTLPFRAKSEWESIKQKFGAAPDPETASQLKRFKGWYKDSMRDYAIAIQALGKGNLTKNEEKLYGAGLPDPGDGIWPNDAPQVYYDAITKRYEELNATIARANYFLNPQGMGLDAKQYKTLVASGNVPSADKMKDIIGSQDPFGDQCFQVLVHEHFFLVGQVFESDKHQL